MSLTILNGNVLDTERMEFVGDRHVTIEGDRIVDVDPSRPSLGTDRVLDARGRFVLPGFIDLFWLTALSTWVEDLQTLDELIPPYSEWQRRIGRYIKYAL